MAQWGEFDFSDFVALRDRLERLKNIDFDAFCMQVTQEITQTFQKKVVARTPGGKTGALKNNWVTDIKKEGSVYTIEVINPLEYAEYVEFGHRKRNNKGWVKGKFMLTITERDIQRNLDAFIKEKLEAFLNEVL